MRYEKNGRFWEIVVQGPKVTEREGKIGAAPTSSKMKVFPDGVTARKALAARRGLQLDAGYLPVQKGARPARSAPLPTSPIEIHIGWHTFCLKDAQARGDQTKWRMPPAASGHDQLLVVHTVRAAGRVPVSIERLEGPPEVDEGAWSQIVRASIAIPSGVLSLQGQEERPVALLDVGKGTFGVLVLSGDLDSGRYDYDEGADHYRVLLWPEPRGTRKLLKKHRAKDEVRRTPDSTGDAALRKAMRGGPHERYHAVVELARRGTPGAALTDKRDVFLRRLATSALGLAAVVDPKQLRGQLGDKDEDVRRRALQSIGLLLADGRLKWSVAGPIVSRCSTDRSPEVRALAHELAVERG